MATIHDISPAYVDEKPINRSHIYSTLRNKLRCKHFNDTTCKENIHNIFPAHLIEQIIKLSDVHSAFKFQATSKAGATSFIKKIADENAKTRTKTILLKSLEQIQKCQSMLTDDNELWKLSQPIIMELLNELQSSQEETTNEELHTWFKGLVEHIMSLCNLQSEDIMFIFAKVAAGKVDEIPPIILQQARTLYQKYKTEYIQGQKWELHVWSIKFKINLKFASISDLSCATILIGIPEKQHGLVLGESKCYVEEKENGLVLRELEGTTKSLPSILLTHDNITRLVDILHNIYGNGMFVEKYDWRETVSICCSTKTHRIPNNASRIEKLSNEICTETLYRLQDTISTRPRIIFCTRPLKRFGRITLKSINPSELDK
jgi:hypothetical protein